MRMHKGQPFLAVEADGEDVPTFSESFLYERVGKGDARFILGVGEEYEHVIRALGPKAVQRLLAVKPALAQRLGTGEKLSQWLEDATSEELLIRQEQRPPQVILDSDAAHAIWRELHGEYRRLFDPEKSMERDQLRAYHALTDGLGWWERQERQKEIDRLPEKLAEQEKRKAELVVQKQQRKDRKAQVEQIITTVLAESDGNVLSDRARRDIADDVERAFRPPRRG